MVKPPLLALVGPTGVGKTAVAVRLAARVGMEAINADSRQVYRGMDVGTGKPTAEEQGALRHHLLDMVDPGERYHAARFRAEALTAVAAIHARGRLPVVVGGTGLYVRALLKGLRPGPPADPALRRALEELALRSGAPALHARLAAAHPEAAAGLHPNDRVRIVRALETLAAGGTVAAPASAQARGETGGAGAQGPDPVPACGPGAEARGGAGDGDWGRSTPPWRVLMIGLGQERDRLNRRLGERVHAMVARGMLEEVQRLLAGGVDESAPGMAGIGYRQFCAVARGALPLAEAERLMSRDTARYAKRQMTWFRRDPEIRWIDVDAAGGVEGVVDSVLKQMHEEGLIE